MRLIILSKNFINKLDMPKFIWTVFVFGLILRLVGIWYGLPLQLNIDEPTLISSVLKLKEDLNPGRFDWPHLYYYINFIFYIIFSAVRKIISLLIELPDVYYSAVPFFLISRALSAFLGAATIIPIYLTTREIFSKKVGYLAAIITAILPIHVYEAHLAKMDTAHTFFTAVAVYYIWQVYKTGKSKNYLFSGLWIGLTTSIKYNGSLLFLPLLVAYSLRKKRWKDNFNLNGIKNLFYSGLMSIIAFYAGTPFAIVDYKKFFSTERNIGALWQFKNVGEVTWQEFPIEIFNTFATMYREHLGMVLWIIFIILLIAFLFFNKRSKEYIFLLFPVIFFSLYISRFDRSPGHYFMFLIPFYVPALGAFIFEIYDKIQKIKFIKKISLWGLIISVLVPSVWSVLKSDFLFSKRDTRNYAYDWIKFNLNEENDFLYVNGEELKSIPFKITETEKVKKVDRSNINRSGPFYLVIGVDGIDRQDMLSGSRDPEGLKGNSEPILKNAELMFEIDNKWKLGPPIYIFRVTEIEK